MRNSTGNPPRRVGGGSPNDLCDYPNNRAGARPAPTRSIAPDYYRHYLVVHQKVSQEPVAMSFAEAWRRRMKSPVKKSLGGEREGFRRGGPLAFLNAKSGFKGHPEIQQARN